MKLKLQVSLCCILFLKQSSVSLQEAQCNGSVTPFLSQLENFFLATFLACGQYRFIGFIWIYIRNIYHLLGKCSTWSFSQQKILLEYLLATVILWGLLIYKPNQYSSVHLVFFNYFNVYLTGCLSDHHAGLNKRPESFFCCVWQRCFSTFHRP